MCLVDVHKVHLKDDSVWAGKMAQLVKSEDLSWNCQNPRAKICVRWCIPVTPVMARWETEAGKFLEALCSASSACSVKLQASRDPVSVNKTDRLS